MLIRLLNTLLLFFELLFLVSFWWQTRINLREVWPQFFSVPLASDYLIPFLYLTDILVVAILLIWLGRKALLISSSEYRLTRPMLGFIKHPVVWLIGFGLLVTVSVGVREIEWWNGYGWGNVILGMGLAWFLSERLRYEQHRRRYAVVLLAGLVVESGILIGEWIHQGTLGLQWIGEWRFSVLTPGVAKIIYNGQEYIRSYATFAHPNIIGGILALGLVVGSWWYWRLRAASGAIRWDTQGKINHTITLLAGNKWVVFSSLLMMSMGLLTTFSRSAWLVAASGGIMVGILARPKLDMKRKLSGKLWVLGGCAVLICMIFVPLIIARFTALDSTDSLSIDRRVQLTRVAQEFIKEWPLWGIGVNNFIPELGKYGPLYGIGVWREPVHNLFLLMIAEVGIIAVVSWLVMVGILIWRIMIGFKSTGKTELGLLLILWFQLCALALVDHYWWTSQQGSLVLWGMVGFSLAMLKMLTNKPIATN